MSEKDMKSPDEGFNIANKGSTRDSQTTQKNKPKPDDIHLKDEITHQHADETDETEESTRNDD